MTRNYNIDCLRILATWLIVVAHVVTNVLARPDFFGGKVWWLSHILFTISVPATPLFFLISGYLLADKQRPFKENLLRTWYRIFVPFSVFTLLGTIVYNALQFRITWNQFLENLLFAGRTHLYFLLGLGILHVLYPFLQQIRLHVSVKDSKIFSFLLLGNSALLILSSFYIDFREMLYLSFLYWFLVMGYFIYGTNYKEFQQNSSGIRKRQKILLVIFGLAINTVISYGCFKLARQNESGWLVRAGEYFQSYLSIPVMMISIAFFNWAMGIDLSRLLTTKIKMILLFLSKYSYGVYLVHMMVLEFLLQRTTLTPYNSQMPLGGFVLLGFGVTLSGSYVISWVLGNMAFLKILVGEGVFPTKTK